MPFTGSHPAAVLPLLRLTRGRVALLPGAMVLGSMTPDLGYYVPLPVSSESMHRLDPLGLGANLLLGLAAWLVWQGLLAPALVVLSPGALRRRLPVSAGAGLRPVVRPRALTMAGISLLVGAATHVLWDAFTHPGLWGAGHIGWLEARHAGHLGTSYAQLGSSVLGALALAGWVVLWWRRTVPGPVEPAGAAGRRLPGTAPRLVALAVVGSAGAAGGVVGLYVWLTTAGFHSLAWYVLTTGGSSLGAAALLVAAVTLLVVAPRPFSPAGRRPGPET